MCGKDDSQAVFFNHLLGSPPHVRERQPNKAASLLAKGITPACAGKTLRR